MLCMSRLAISTSTVLEMICGQCNYNHLHSEVCSAANGKILANNSFQGQEAL